MLLYGLTFFLKDKLIVILISFYIVLFVVFFIYTILKFA